MVNGSSSSWLFSYRLGEKRADFYALSPYFDIFERLRRNDVIAKIAVMRGRLGTEDGKKVGSLSAFRSAFP